LHWFHNDDDDDDIFWQMAALEMPANGEVSHNVGQDIIHKALDSVEDKPQKVLFLHCLLHLSLVMKLLVAVIFV